MSLKALERGGHAVELVRWLSSSTGRVAQIVAGLGLIALGLSTRNSWTSAVLWVAVGVLPLVGGLFDLNFLSAVMGGPLRGDEVKELGQNRIQ